MRTGCPAKNGLPTQPALGLWTTRLLYPTLPTIMKKLLIALFSILATAASLYFLLHKPVEKAEQAATNASEALGQRAGEEVARLVGNKGEIAVMSLDIAPGQAPTFVAQMDRFVKTLKKHGVKVGAIKLMPGGLTALVLGTGLPAQDYAELVQQSPNAGAIVSFVGPPNLPPAELQKFQADHPPLVVIDTFGVLKGPALPAMLETKAVALAFEPLNSLEAEKEKLRADLFDRYYRILRPPAQSP